MAPTVPLRLTAKQIIEHLFNGGFRPFDKYDWAVYADAAAGSLIADISIGKYMYQVIFSPIEGDFEVYYADIDGQPLCWNVNPITGMVIEM